MLNAFTVMLSAGQEEEGVEKKKKKKKIVPILWYQKSCKVLFP